MNNGRILVYPRNPKRIIKKMIVYAVVIIFLTVTAGLFWDKPSLQGD